LLAIPKRLDYIVLDDPTNDCCTGCGTGSGFLSLSEWYYQAVKMPLWRLLCIVFFSYLCYIFAFGLAVYLSNVVGNTTLTYGGALPNVTNHPPSFRDSFAMAHQTISTIGYGHIAPASDASHILVVVFGAFGLIFSSLIVAIIWSRVTAITPIMAFTNKAVISKWNGRLALRFKIAGLWRPKPILTGNVKCSVVMTVSGEDGLAISRLLQLKVQTEYNPLMVLPWTVVHVIDETSPLYGVTERTWESTVRLVTTVFSGMDSCTGHEISAMYAYPSSNVVWDHRFATTIHVQSQTGVMTVNMLKFHELRPTNTMYRLALQKKFIKTLRKIVVERKRAGNYIHQLSIGDDAGVEIREKKGVAESEGGGDVEMVRLEH